MSNNTEISTHKKAINRYINKWRTNNPSIIQIKEKEEEYNQLKLQYDDAYKTYIQNVKKGTQENSEEKGDDGFELIDVSVKPSK